MSGRRMNRGRLASLAFGVVIGVLVLSVSSASASYSGSNGLIAFVRAVNGQNQIFTMTSGGGNQTNISNNTSYADTDPQWTSDGQKLVFQRCCVNGVDQIFIMNGDGSQQTNLSNDQSDETEPSVSPNGSQVVYSSYDGLWLMNSDGSNKAQITANGYDQNPRWSPDGTKILLDSYTSSYYTYVIETVNTAGGARTTYGSSSCYTDQTPDWSPTGSAIVFTRFNSRCTLGGGSIWTMTSSGANQTDVSQGGNDSTPAWSPDGSKIAFVRSGTIYTMTSSGGSQTAIAAGTQPAWEPTSSTISPVTGLSADTSTSGQVTLSWNNSFGGNVAGDVVRRDASNSCPTSATGGTGIGDTTLRTSQVDTSVSLGTSYCYTVFVTDGSGDYSVAKSIIVSVPVSTLSPVSGLQADTSVSGQVGLSWSNPSGIAGDVVRRGSSSSCPAAATSGTGIGDSSLRTSQVDTTVAEGTTYCYSVFTTNGSGGYSSASSITVSVPVPANGPTITKLTQGLQLGSVLGLPQPTTVAVLISWAATSNSGEGICSYKLKQNVNAGTYKTVTLSSATATSVVVNLAAGTKTVPNSYGFQLTANDCDGSNSIDTLAPFLVLAVPENANPKVAYSSGWKRVASSTAVGGFVEQATTKGAWATLTTAGSNLSLVAPIGPTYGKATIYVDGVKKQTLNLNRATKGQRLIEYKIGFSTLTTHVLKIVVAGTAGHPTVPIDAFAVLGG